MRSRWNLEGWLASERAAADSQTDDRQTAWYFFRQREVNRWSEPHGAIAPFIQGEDGGAKGVV